MRSLEVRRHSAAKNRREGGSYLSMEGVALARRVGEAIGPFDVVIATPVPRTVETAIAMGFAVDHVIDAGLDDAFWEAAARHDHWAWEEPFSSYRAAIAIDGAVARVGRTQRDAWVDALAMAPEDGSVLAISHGHAIEAGLVTCLERIDGETGEGPFDHVEGFRCRYDGRFRDAEILRVSATD